VLPLLGGRATLVRYADDFGLSCTFSGGGVSEKWLESLG